MVKKEESPLFVGITNGNDLRRSMLECSKDILESLKEHEQLKNIREEKVGLIQQLKGDVKDLSKLINSLKGYLPKVKDAGIKKVEVKKIVSEPKLIKVEKPKASSEVDKLEAELNDIEAKLNSLS
jgi:predicted nuclease with TOPRIM domain